jgi:hypothetical protein
LFERRVKLGETIAQESLTVRNPVFHVDAQFFGNLKCQTFHEGRGPNRVGHLFVNFHVQLDRPKDTRTGRQNSVQDTDVPLSQEIVQGDGTQGVQGGHDQDGNVELGRKFLVKQVVFIVVFMVRVTLLLKLLEELLLILVPTPPVLIERHSYFNAPKKTLTDKQLRSSCVATGFNLCSRVSRELR